MKSASMMFLLLIGVVTGRRLREVSNALQQEQLSVTDITEYRSSEKQAEYIRNCVDLNGEKPLEQEKQVGEKKGSSFKCPDKTTKNEEQKATDDWLTKASEYWATWEKETKKKHKYGFSKARDIKKLSPKVMAKLKEARDKKKISFKSGMPWDPDLKWPKGRIYFCIERGLSEFAIRKGFRVAFKGTKITYTQVPCNNPNYKIIFKKLVVNARQEEESGEIQLGSSTVGYMKEYDADFEAAKRTTSFAPQTKCGSNKGSG